MGRESRARPIIAKLIYSHSAGCAARHIYIYANISGGAPRREFECHRLQGSLFRGMSCKEGGGGEAEFCVFSMALTMFDEVLKG